ncbi:MAG: ATP-binding cassette domain-containing protein [Desulfobulbaceae bacterium]|nr:ATP-binding cassette domain-containing protein [Desulfobulbaceae bacterium]
MIYNISHLTKKYRKRVVLDIKELTLKRGRIHALLGPNGSGKTTLLNLLAFLDTPTSGTISFLGKNIERTESALVALRRKVVLVDQYPIFFSRSVYHNLEFGLKIRKIPKPTRKKRILQALELVGMTTFSKSRAHTLSGGETKRAALARALVLQPEVLLCDEPFANVDTENQEHIFKILQEINGNQKISIIFSSHDRPKAELLAHETLYLNNGSLADNRLNNVFPSIPDEIPGQYKIQIAQKYVFLKGPVNPGGLHKQRCCNLYIDPEKIKLLTHNHLSSEPGHITATVQEIRKHRKGIKIIAQSEIRLHLHLSSKEYRNNPPLVGQKISLIIAQDAVTILPTQN